MDARLDSSHFLDKEEPFSTVSGGLNSRLLTEYIDVPQDDDSFRAACIRQMTQIVGRCITPKQMLGVLRVLKAVTLCFLTLTALADVMFIIFLEIMADSEVKQLFGGTRDTIIRLYGLAMIAISVSIEIDFTRIVKKFSGLKGFIPRGLLMIFIAVVTSSHPLVDDEPDYNAAAAAYYYQQQQQQQQDGEGGGYNNNGYGGYGDDAYASYMNSQPSQQTVEYPNSAVNFQLVVSFML